MQFGKSYQILPKLNEVKAPVSGNPGHCKSSQETNQGQEIILNTTTSACCNQLTMMEKRKMMMMARAVAPSNFKDGRSTFASFSFSYSISIPSLPPLRIFIMTMISMTYRGCLTSAKLSNKYFVAGQQSVCLMHSTYQPSGRCLSTFHKNCLSKKCVSLKT